MEAMFARYFDGDLSDRETQEFLDAVESDPGMERELRAYERVLAAGKAIPDPVVPAGFTASVMGEIAATPRRARPRLRLADFGMRWAPAAAAVAILAFVGGWWMGHEQGAEPIPPDGLGNTTSIHPATASSKLALDSQLHYVRLAYVAANPGVQQVTVAGTFNGWESTALPLQQRDGVWSTIIVLRPGVYEYMFVEDGDRWVTDPLAIETRDDGFGGQNAVLDLAL